MQKLLPLLLSSIIYAADIPLDLQDGGAEAMLKHQLMTDAVWNQFKQHGCWCSRWNTLNPDSANNLAMDTLDQLCRDWFKTRICTTRACDTTIGEYDVTGNSCSNNNAGCNTDICMVDFVRAAEIMAEIEASSWTTATVISDTSTCQRSPMTRIDICATESVPSSLPTVSTNDVVLHEACGGLGGWQLVRRTHQQYYWHPATDQLRGTEVYGTPSTDKLAASTFSIKFDDIPFSEFCFASGDETIWLRATKFAVNGEWYNNALRDIISSSKNASPYQARWYHRNGVSEDPWVSLSDHNVYDIVYGEASFQAGSSSAVWNWIFRQSTGGANVFIK
jgi:hypothetical protein